MPADFGAILGRTLNIHARTGDQIAQCGDAQTLQHHIKTGRIGVDQLGYRQANAIDRNARANLQIDRKTCRKTNFKGADTARVANGFDRTHTLHNAGKHALLLRRGRDQQLPVFGELQSPSQVRANGGFFQHSGP